MTIEQAIEILYQKQLAYCRSCDSNFRDALKLGIEALKRTKAQYDPDHQMMRIPLPGETLE